MPLTRAEALTGSLLGQALGDALGFVVEAAHPVIAHEYVAACLKGGGAGTRSHPRYSFGQYSDDTQLARELLIAFRDAGGWAPAVYASGIALLFHEGRDVGAGPGTRAAAARLHAGTPWEAAGTPAPYAGNGSAMRAAPVGILFRDDIPRLLEVAVEQSGITHADTRCAAGSIAVAGAAALASKGGSIVPGEFLDCLAEWAGPTDAGMGAAIGSVAAWLDLPPEAAVLRLHESGLDHPHVGEWRGVSSFVLPSVAWSLYAFLRTPDDYWATVCTAIGAGGDTDTMAAMAGALAGARLGARALPSETLLAVNDRGTWSVGDLTKLSEACARIAETNTAPS